MKGRGNFWEDIKPATKYLQPVGDAMMKKAIEKINQVPDFNHLKIRTTKWFRLCKTDGHISIFMRIDKFIRICQLLSKFPGSILFKNINLPLEIIQFYMRLLLPSCPRRFIIKKTM
jgi:hypothetical protein